MAYLDVMVTLVFAMVFFWFCYETIVLRLFYKPDINKTLATFISHSPTLCRTNTHLDIPAAWISFENRKWKIENFF